MWTLDRDNSGELIEQLRSHARYPDTLSVLRVGQGWRDLVRDCHERLRQAFPDYELLNVKQKYGVLEFQAFPRPCAADDPRWSIEELTDLDEITDEFRDRSEAVCECCGSAGRLRSWRSWELTLCDDCDGRFPDPPYELRGKKPKRSS